MTGLGLPLTALVVGTPLMVGGAPAAADEGPSPRPKLSEFRFAPQPLTPGQTGFFSFITTREGGATITLERQLAGRRAPTGGGCVAPRQAPRGASCLRALPAGRLRFAADAGEARKRFNGRIGGKALAAGRYRATLLILNDAFGDSDPARLTLRIAAK